jgi:tripartite-type tricarboxylate transporter receptor subunit TctC
MKPSRRQFLLAAASAAALPALPASVRAQTFPARPLTLVVPIAAGGAVDTAARIMAEGLHARIGQAVVVENRPGAGSIIGSSFVAKASPDGYTLLLMEPGAVLAKWLNRTVPFDVTADFSPIAMIAHAPLALFAHPSVPFNDLKELIAYSKANPGKLSVGTPGVGTPHHLAAAWLNTATGITIQHVPYRGVAPALNDLLGGQIALMWASPVAVLPFFQQGKVKMLAVSTQQRDAMLPQVPTVAESGVAGFDTTNWFGIAAPAKTMPAIVARIGQAVREATELSDVRKRMSSLGYNLDYGDSEQFRERIITDHEKYGAIIREAGIRPD